MVFKLKLKIINKCMFLLVSCRVCNWIKHFYLLIFFEVLDEYITEMLKKTREDNILKVYKDLWNGIADDIWQWFNLVIEEQRRPKL